MVQIVSNRIYKNSVERVLNPLKELADIDYFSYCAYTDEQCDLVCSNFDEIMDFVHDEGTVMPLGVGGNSSILEWNRFHSDEYLKYVSDHYNYSKNGVTFVLRHVNGNAEHISFTSHNKEVDLVSKISFRPKLIQVIVSHVRNHINFKKERFKNIILERGVLSLDKDECEVKKKLSEVSSKKTYMFGVNGETHITKMEKRVLLSLMKMKTTRLIAESLGVSIRTVECHLSSLKMKLGAFTRHDLYRIASQNFLAPIGS